MTDDMGRLLGDASDDSGRPLGFALEELVVRGRSQVRRRRSGYAAVAGLSVAGVVAGGFAVLPSDRDHATDPATSDGLVERCAELDRAFVTEVGADVPPVDDWSIMVRESGDAAVSLILAPDDGEGYAYCRLDQTGSDTYDDYSRWGSADGGQLTFDLADGQGGHIVVTAAGSWTDGSLAFETADGMTSEPVRHGPYYLWQHEMDGIDPTAPVNVTYYRPGGSVINSENLNDPEAEWDNPQPDLPGVDGSSSDSFEFRIGTRDCWIAFDADGRMVAPVDRDRSDDCRELLKQIRRDAP